MATARCVRVLVRSLGSHLPGLKTEKRPAHALATATGMATGHAGRCHTYNTVLARTLPISMPTHLPSRALYLSPES
jgi:hypothetical protein